ncbi:phosphatidylinositol-3,5-bisphosphate 5-phosphatase [Spiromyces aspiralis]|uniref:Phosphatidylinositol-3,5-bisphosphate 5-phosphatase n=1 Tax=Spiromyces aspiralis TaxID=68401 RepID=A0ACC1HI46_9FUNG|nr:phosphatidylinositol-3,5-bisphosphate 5-phosphatase [Spiromyces aspiralis]
MSSKDHHSGATRAGSDRCSSYSGDTVPGEVLDKFEVQCNKAYIYITGQSIHRDYYRLLIIDRLSVPFGGVSSVKSGDNVRDAAPMRQQQQQQQQQLPQPQQPHMTYDDGRKYSTHEEVQRKISDHIFRNPHGGQLRTIVEVAYGIIGFIRFTRSFYMSIVTKRRAVALLGGSYIYHIEDTILLSVSPRAEKSRGETRMLTLFRNVDLTKNFYFSYTYDITNTLQVNMSSTPGQGKRENSMFVWNDYMIRNGMDVLGISKVWMMSLIHGYVDQSVVASMGRDVYLTLIARRSQIYAGVRFLRRGVDSEGYVANEVETEQIVNTIGVGVGAGSDFRSYTSFVQHRGSIPLNWSQDTSTMAPKPPIELTVRDPYYVQAYRHFVQLIERYGGPIIVLNLIKTKERYKRESLLGEEFSECIRHINQYLGSGKRKIRYIGWDMSKAKKNRDADVLTILEEIGEETLAITGIFHGGSEPYYNYLKRSMLSAEDSATGGDSGGEGYREGPRYQRGIVRSNCIDCLDRTNAAQTIIGKTAFAHQLYELGVINRPYLSFDTDANNMLEEMYHDLGDTIALQYGGSNLVNTIETYRRINNWSSHSRDMIEALRRYYSNSFVDAERQEGIDMFLGISPRLGNKGGSNGRGLDLKPRYLDQCTCEETEGSLHYGEMSREGDSLDGSAGEVDDSVGVVYDDTLPPSMRASVDSVPRAENDGEQRSDARLTANGGGSGSSKYNSTLIEVAAGRGGRDRPNGQDQPCGMPLRSTLSRTYWNEFYRPEEYTEFDNFYLLKMNSTSRYNERATYAGLPSNPFVDRGDSLTTGSVTAPPASGEGTADIGASSETIVQGNKGGLRSKVRKEPKWLKAEHAVPCTSPPIVAQNIIGDSKSVIGERRHPPIASLRQYDEYFARIPSIKETYERLVKNQSASPALAQQMKQLYKQHNVGGWYTDGVTVALQQPEITEEEYRQYERYVHQFDDLPQWVQGPTLNEWQKPLPRQQQQQPAVAGDEDQEIGTKLYRSNTYSGPTGLYNAANEDVKVVLPKHRTLLQQSHNKRSWVDNRPKSRYYHHHHHHHHEMPSNDARNDYNSIVDGTIQEEHRESEYSDDEDDGRYGIDEPIVHQADLDIYQAFAAIQISR